MLIFNSFYIPLRWDTEKEKKKISSHLVRITLNLSFFCFLFFSLQLCPVESQSPQEMVHLQGMSSHWTVKWPMIVMRASSWMLVSKLQPCVRRTDCGATGGSPPRANVSVQCSAWLHRFKEEQIHGWELWLPQCKILSLSIWAFVSSLWSCYISLFHISHSNHQHNLCSREGGSYGITLGPSAPRPWNVHRESWPCCHVQFGEIQSGGYWDIKHSTQSIKT